MEEITYTVTLPSGLCGEIREPEVGDIRILTGRTKRSKKEQKKDPIAAFFASIWLDTIDPGPYKWSGNKVFDKDGRPDWLKILQGDTSWLILKIRQLMFGDPFNFVIDCPGRMCGEPVQGHIKVCDILDDTSLLSEEALAKIKEYGTNDSESLFEVVLPKRKVTVGWKLLTRGDQWGVDRIVDVKQDPEEADIVSITTRLPYIAGLSSPAERRNFARRLPQADADFLQRETEKHDLCVTDTLEIKCNSCRRTYKVPFPIDADFFSGSSAEPVSNEDPGINELYTDLVINTSEGEDIAGQEVRS